MSEFNGIILCNLNNYVVQQHVMRYIFAAKFVRDKVVLDIACGSGYGSKYLANFAKKVYGVDISKEIIEFAKNHYRKVNLVFLQGDATTLPFPDKLFDVVISFETIEHISDYEKFLKEVKRVLKTNGLFICSTPNKKYTQHPYYHVKEFYPDEFFCFLEKHFRKVERYGQYISPLTLSKDKLYGLAGKILSLFPCKERIKGFLRRGVGASPDTNCKVYEIRDEYAILFRSNRVVPINDKDQKFKLLRIMIAVCEN